MCTANGDESSVTSSSEGDDLLNLFGRPRLYVELRPRKIGFCPRMMEVGCRSVKRHGRLHSGKLSLDMGIHGGHNYRTRALAESASDVLH